MTRPVAERLAIFFGHTMDRAWEGDDWDGGSIHDLADHLGLIAKVEGGFNPEVHDAGRSGDDGFAIAPDVRELLKGTT